MWETMDHGLLVMYPSTFLPPLSMTSHVWGWPPSAIHWHLESTEECLPASNRSTKGWLIGRDGEQRSIHVAAAHWTGFSMLCLAFCYHHSVKEDWKDASNKCGLKCNLACTTGTSTERVNRLWNFTFWSRILLDRNWVGFALLIMWRECSYL